MVIGRRYHGVVNGELIAIRTYLNLLIDGPHIHPRHQRLVLEHLLERAAGREQPYVELLYGQTVAAAVKFGLGGAAQGRAGEDQPRAAGLRFDVQSGRIHVRLEALDDAVAREGQRRPAHHGIARQALLSELSNFGVRRE